MIKTKYLFLFLFYSNLIFSQDILLKNQLEIDSFFINYPNVENITSLQVSGKDVVNLIGLSQLSYIERWIIIRGTNISNLKGLNNLVELGSNSLKKSIIWFSGNNKLKSIAEIGNLKVYNNCNVIIRHNPNLNNCEISPLCNLIKNYNDILIYDNGIGCEDWETIKSNCNFPIDSTEKKIIFFERFEDWSLNKSSNWELNLHYGQQEKNYYYTTKSLIEGDSSLVINGNAYIQNVPEYYTSEITHFLDKHEQLVDIEFTYQCIGKGFCGLRIIQNDTLLNTSSSRIIWREAATDSTIHTAKLQNISTYQENETFSGIMFFSRATETQEYYPNDTCDFIIDNIIVKKNQTSKTNDINRKLNVTVYPNPSMDILHIKSYYKFKEVKIINLSGEVKLKQIFENTLDIRNLNSGIYFIQFSDDNKSIIKKIIKI